jgi:hypothetical protein
VAPQPIPANIRVNRSAAAVHRATVNPDGSINFPRCGAPGNTPAAFRAFRPVVVTDAVTCKRCSRAAEVSA